MAIIHNPDFVAENHGTLIMLQPVSDAAKEWVAEHLPEDAQWLGPRVAIDHRCYPPIADGIVNDGFVLA